MKKTALVRLTTDERAQLQRLLAVGQAPTRQLTHARILLKADEAPGGPGWTDRQIGVALDTSLCWPFGTSARSLAAAYATRR